MNMSFRSVSLSSALIVTSLLAMPDRVWAQQGDGSPEGAVYAMTNEVTGNRIVAYARAADGTLSQIGSFATGGLGAAFDGGEGLDPLISAYSLLVTDDRQFLLAVNAGSSSLTAFRINDDFSLTRTDRVRTNGTGPNSIACRDGLVYVSNIDFDGVFNGEPDQEGSLLGYRLDDNGQLTRIPQSRRLLGNRPAAIQFSPDGRFLLASSINAGSAALASGNTNAIAAYRVFPSGRVSRRPVGAATSTLPGNAENRNLPSAIGFEVVESGGEQLVIVTEAREFQADGTPPTLPNLQTGSVSTWAIGPRGRLLPRQLDVLTGNDMFDGERTACWIEMSADQSYFWVSNALESTLSSYSLENGTIQLLDRVAAAGNPPSDDNPFETTDGWVDLWISDDGNTIYQLFGLTGAIGVFQVDGPDLTLIQLVEGDLPMVNTQGIVAI